MVSINYNELDKVTFTRWVDEVLGQSLTKNTLIHVLRLAKYGLLT
jgi:hypothetical protein